MEKIFRRTTQGATLGGIIGGAVGSVLTAGSVVVLGPVSIPALCLVAGASAVAGGVSASAIGTLIGGGVGAVTGTAETMYDKKHAKKRER